MKKTIYVVDDNDTNLITAEEALEKYYRVITLPSALRMFAMMENVRPDLILLDVKMPGMNGFDALSQLKAMDKFNMIPVIFLTGLTDSGNEAMGINLGAVDFISKPFSEAVLINRIKYHLHIDDFIKGRTEQLQEKTDQLIRLQNGIVNAMADLVERRDNNTGGHIDRTTIYMKILLNAMIENGLYQNEMQGWDIETVVSSARLHDVGKVSVPDVILNKPGRLSAEEFEIVKKHANEGEKIIERMMEDVGSDMKFLHSAKLLAAYHHERWDGKGYPYQLTGESIPLHGRIMSVVDVYDALTSERPYKKAFSVNDSMEIIKKDAGSAFDPKIAELFLTLKDKLETARMELGFTYY